MKTKVKTQNDICKSVVIECTPIECLTLLLALKHSMNDVDIHPTDQAIMRDMIDGELIFEKI